MWFLTVFGLMCSSAAICALSLPFAISFSTSISRSDSSRPDRSASRCDALDARTRWSTFAAIVGETSDSPTAAERMPEHQLVDRRVLEQVAAGAGDDRVHHVGVLVRDRQHEHAGQRREHRDLPRRLDAADPRHVQVHDDDVGRDLADGAQRLGAVVALADHLDALLLEQVAQPGPEQVVVVHEQDARRCRSRVSLRSLSSAYLGAAARSVAGRARRQ